MTLSVILVSYNVRLFLDQALISLQNALTGYDHEIIVVDNASTDGSADFVFRKFPRVRLIKNKSNVGFARANNQALSVCQGDYICLINPDTIVQENTFTVLLKFLQEHSRAGLVTCKVLNPDGTLQLACRRSFPTAWIAFTKITGLAALFPKTRLFGRYNLTFLHPEKTVKVQAVSGSFMFLRREVLNTVGMLDENFFMYGEDLDWCFRIHNTGYEIFYVPETQIIHFKGESSKKSPFEQRRLFYEAMRLFVKKHFRGRQAYIPSWILIGAIWIRAVFSYGNHLLKAFAIPLLDFFFMTIAMIIAILFRFYPEFPWQAFLKVHLLYSIVWLSSLAAHDAFKRWRFSGSKVAGAVAIGWLVNAVITYFIKSIAYSRAVILYAGAMNMIFLPGWRILLYSLAKRYGHSVNRLFRFPVLGVRSVLVGDRQSIKKIIKRLRESNHYESIVGVIISSDHIGEHEIEGVPVLGKLKDINEIVARERIDQAIFSIKTMTYNKVVTTIAGNQTGRMQYKLIPSDMNVMISKTSIDYIDDFPMIDIDYKLQNSFFRLVKRLFDLVLALLFLVLTLPVIAWLYLIKRKKIVRRSTFGDKKAGTPYHLFSGGEKSGWSVFLPALFDILRGRLSFVGRDLHIKPSDSNLGHLLKPGLTGLEQLHKTGLSKREREGYHLYYLQNYSPFLDLEIMLKSLFRQQYVT